jgi:hypothetical protein
MSTQKFCKVLVLLSCRAYQFGQERLEFSRLAQLLLYRWKETGSGPGDLPLEKLNTSHCDSASSMGEWFNALTREKE